MHTAVLNADFLIDTPWYRKTAWAGIALMVHVSIFAIATMFYHAPQPAPDVFNVSLLPMSEPAATPPTPAAKSQPVVKQSQPKPVVMPKPAPTNSPTAISQAQPIATSSAPANETQSTAAPSGANKPTSEAITPAHDAAYLNNPAPKYPDISKRLGEYGNVVLEAYVLPDGKPSKVEISKSSGYSRLDQAALEAAKRWTFVPAKRGSEAVASLTKFTIQFVIPER